MDERKCDKCGRKLEINGNAQGEGYWHGEFYLKYSAFVSLRKGHYCEKCCQKIMKFCNLK